MADKKKGYSGRYPKQVMLRLTYYQWSQLRDVCFTLQLSATAFLRALITQALKEREPK